MFLATDCGRRRGAGIALTAWLTALTWLLPVASAVGAGADPDVAVLAAAGTKATAGGVAVLLGRIPAGPFDAVAIEAWVAQLGHGRYRRRAAAMRKLLALPVLPERALAAAANSDDEQLRHRAAYVLDHVGKRTRQATLLAALRIVARKRLKVPVALILNVVPLLGVDAYGSIPPAALAVSAGLKDLPVLHAAVKGARPSVRAAAAGALLRAMGKEAAAETRPLLRDPVDRVRLATATAFARIDDRACLPVLVALLGSKQLDVRLRSAALLRALTGQDFGLTSFLSPADRAKAVDAWARWVDKEGKTARLRPPPAAVGTSLGRTVFCDTANGAVIEVNMAGKETFRAKVGATPWGVQALPNGNILVGCYGTKEILELARSGKVVWKKTGLAGGPMSVQRLPNGNTLSALSDANKVVEIAPSGKIVWSAAVAGRPADARRLPNGRTLVAAHKQNRLVELDAAGKVVWQMPGLRDPQRVQRLPGGNTLVALTLGNAVAEYDAKRRQVWTRGGFNIALDAQRLPGGNTLVVDQRGIWEINPKGTVVWKIQRAGISRAWRH